MKKSGGNELNVMRKLPVCYLKQAKIPFFLFSSTKSKNRRVEQVLPRRRLVTVRGERWLRKGTGG
jgi:hypothetical protein